MGPVFFKQPVCTIKCATITRELKVAATWDLDHFVAIDTGQVTYISDYGLYPGTTKQTPPPGKFWFIRAGEKII